MHDNSKQPLHRLEDLLGTPDFFRDPHPVYHQLRTEAPVYWCQKWTRWLVTRHDDVQAVMRDPQTFSNTDRLPVLLEQLDDSARTRLENLQRHIRRQGLVNSDPPFHTRLRKLANKVFTPSTLEKWRPRVEEIVSMLMERIEPRTPFNFINAVAFPLPTIIVAEMLGARPEDWEKFRIWSEGFVGFSQSGKVDFELALVAERCTMEMTAYFQDVIARRRAAPEDDLVSALVVANEQGETLSDSEVLDTCVTLLIAGHETTTSLIGNGVLELLRNPSQMEMLRTDPGLWKTAVEEMLRFHSPVLSMHRRATKDVVLRGQHIPAGDLVYVVLAAANRDPNVFSEPDRFDIRRPMAENRHVAFGYGIHFCLGAPLSRMEAPIAIRTLMDRFPKLRLDGEPKWKANTMVRFLEALPVRG